MATMTFVGLFMATALAAAQPVTLPDPSKGAINGRVALMFWPGSMTRTGLKPLPKTAGCTVHLALLDDQARETVYPCGQWFQPPVPARYIKWLEQGDAFSYQNIIGYAGEPFRGRGLIAIDPLYPASSVKLAPQIKLRPDQTFRFVSLKLEGDLRMFDRRIPAARAPNAVFRLPVGPVVGGIFDDKGRALALSRPVNAAAGQTTAIAPERPRSGGDALVVVDRNLPVRQALPKCQMRFAVEGKDLPPAVSLVTRDRLLYIWYELRPGDAHVALRCGEKSIDRDIRVTAREIVTLRDELP